MQDQLPQGTVVGGQQAKYEVLNSVGRGGMGVVYRARRTTDQAVIALKEMRPADATKPEEQQEFRMLFTQEAELLLRLDHPNIVDAFETFEWHGRPYFVMEFVNGVTLEKRLRDANAPAFEQDALVWAIQMARVLGYLHVQQPPVIYRDLKPGNVILTPDSVIKFIDFGVARQYKAGKSKDTVAIGTYGYAPPEQYGKGQTDAQSDLYTLGATLYHLLTNLGPIPLRTPEPGSIQQHNPSVKPAVEQVVIKAMQQDRSFRFRNAQEMENGDDRVSNRPAASKRNTARRAGVFQTRRSAPARPWCRRKRDPRQRNHHSQHECQSHEHQLRSAAIPCFARIVGVATKQARVSARRVALSYPPALPQPRNHARCPATNPTVALGTLCRDDAAWHLGFSAGQLPLPHRAARSVTVAFSRTRPRGLRSWSCVAPPRRDRTTRHAVCPHRRWQRQRNLAQRHKGAVAPTTNSPTG